jgi:glycogen(starch) synthase
MRILFWSELFWPYVGGAEVLGAQLLGGLARRGYEFAVVTSHDHLELPDEVDYHGIPVYRFPFRSALATGNIGQLMEAREKITRLKRVWAPELIHINAVGPSALFQLQTAEAYRARVLVTLHTLHGELENAQSGGRDTLLTKTLKAATWVTCVSAAVLHDALKQMPEIAASSSIIYNGLDDPDVAVKPPPFDAQRLLCVGRLVHDKGFDVALIAFSKLLGRFPQARLIIAGDGPMRPALQEQASKLGLKDHIEFIGWVAPERVPELINTATLVVMPSRCEGLPLVGIQAAQMARPVVATRVGGIPELFLDQRTGFLVEKEDAGSLARAIAFLLDHPSFACEIGAAARRRAREIFSLDRCIDAYHALYGKLLQKVPSAALA